MTFNSLAFVAFFILTVSLYWALPHRWQNRLLLAASYVFYGWIHPWFLALIATTTIVDYSAALAVERWPAHKRRLLWTAVCINLGLLGFFKYFGFFVDNVVAAAGLAGWQLPRPLIDVVLPVGISFYTFQSMGYTIDVYRGRTAARRSLLDMALFVSFFPTLLAGPIMRSTTLLPQIERERRFSAASSRDATLLMTWGFFKKLVIADNVGVIANKVFALRAPDFHLLWAGVFAFAVQIYADFSAYTDIARGAAGWLGFDLARNFDHPFLAAGPADFWRRWNISLTTWLRDYVFLPLSYAFSRRVRDVRRLGFSPDIRIYAGATMLTFLLSGLWHGANWNFVLWGGYHGALLIVARWARTIGRQRRAIRRWLGPFRVAGMFGLTCVGWLIFRETDLGMLVRDLTLSPVGVARLHRQAGAYLLALGALYSVPLWVHAFCARSGRLDLTAAMTMSEARPRVAAVVAQAALAGLMFVAILVLRSQTSLDFIYFRF